MLKTIDLYNFTSEILRAEAPILLAGIRRGSAFKQQVETVERLADQYLLKIDFRLLAQDSIRAFGAAFNINGTPFFIVFHSGKQIGRLLGSADHKKLKSFLRKILKSSWENDNEHTTSADG